MKMNNEDVTKSHDTSTASQRPLQVIQKNKLEKVNFFYLPFYDNEKNPISLEGFLTK